MFMSDKKRTKNGTYAKLLLIPLIVCNSFLFGKHSQTIGSEGLKCSRFDEGHLGVVLTKFGEYHGKILPVGLFPPANFKNFAEFKCYFHGNLFIVLAIVLVVKLPLTTSAEVPDSTLCHD